MANAAATMCSKSAMAMGRRDVIGPSNLARVDGMTCNLAGMSESRPSFQGEASVIELGQEHLLEDFGDRASLLNAAANARNVAMLTGTHGVVAMPLVDATLTLPEPAAFAPGGVVPAEADDGRRTALLRARLSALSDADVTGRAKTLLELAWAKLEEGDAASAHELASSAAALAPDLAAPHALLRTMVTGRARAKEQLTHVEVLVASADSDGVRADWLSEKGRLLEVTTGERAASIALQMEALACAPDHGAALYALEASLDVEGRHAELEAHWARLAALTATREEAAWITVERAIVLDRRLNDVAGARAAFEHALELDGGIGAVRQAVTDHAVLHRDDGRTASLLESEAALERDPARAARLLLDAALLHARASSPEARAAKLLERAHALAPTSPLVDGRVVAELVAVHEAQGRHGELLRVRKSALRMASGPREELVALKAVALAADRASAPHEAVQALERARLLAPDDPTLLAELDRQLARAGRHDARAVLWTREAALADSPAQKARALTASAESLRAAGRDADAQRQYEAAWRARPGEPGIFDVLIERLGAAGSSEAVRGRVTLYEHAARVEKDRGKRLHYLEKIAWLWDDVAGDALRAAAAWADVLALDERRTSAIAGLASAAARAGDTRQLARALLLDAEVSEEPRARAELRLRAASTLRELDPDRALELASSLVTEPEVGGRAGELVTALHTAAGRWELVARSLGERAAREEGAARTSLILEQAALVRARLGDPRRAAEILDALADEATRDAGVARERVETLVRLGDRARLRDELARLGQGAEDPIARVGWLLRAAEIDEGSGDDEAALALYREAASVLPDEPWVRDRVVRLGARCEVPADLVPVLVRAVRSLDRDGQESLSEPLLASGARDVPTLRTAERLARRAGSAPQLANVLSIAAQEAKGILGRRALEGVLSLVRFELPESDDAEPWAHLLASGSSDAVLLDDLVQQVRPAARRGELRAIALASAAIKRRLEGVSATTERVLGLLSLSTLARAAGTPREAAAFAREALSVDATSVSAMLLLAELAAETRDRRLAIVAARALAPLVVDRVARARLLREAGDLSVAEREGEAAAALFESALEADPNDVAVAARLAHLQAERGAFAELARVLQRFVHVASTSDAVVPMASELADVARNRLSDPKLAIEALERSRQVAPAHVPTLFLLAELYIGQRAWQDAATALGEVIESSDAAEEKLTALVGRASIFGRVLNDVARSEQELRRALTIDPHDARVIRLLLKLPDVVKGDERAALLSRLVGTAMPPAERRALLLELSAARQASGDAGGAEGALVEAAAMAPDPAMFDRLQRSAGGDREAAVRLLSRALGRARDQGVVAGPFWLVGLGELELGLGRLDDAIERFEEALELEPKHDSARMSLARALGKKGHHDQAAAALWPVVESSAAVDVRVLRMLGDAFEGAGRAQQAMVVSEVRAMVGDLDPARISALSARRSVISQRSEALSRASLRSFVMPSELGKHPIWDVAALAEGIQGKLARVALSEHGASSRGRIKPRAVHPLRQLFDRLAMAFELTDVEFAVSENVSSPLVAVEDAPWVVVPTALGDWPEPFAVAAMVRPLVRIALGVPWLGALGSSEVLAILVGLARQVAPAFGAVPPERVEPLVADYELRGRRAIDRKRRRALEELEPNLERAPLVSEQAFVEAVARCEARAAFLLSGDLRASLEAVASDEARFLDALRSRSGEALRAILGSGTARDLMTFAIGPDATALRLRLGTLWS